MKKYIIGLGVLGALLLSGCTEPAFDRNSKKITFVNGKAYNIPQGARYLPVDSKKARKFSSVGIPCKNGDTVWISNKALNSINDTAAEYVAAYRQGLLGCARPLNNQEYQYRLNQQNQNSANTRAFNQQQNFNNQMMLNRSSQQLSNTTNNIVNNATRGIYGY